MPLRKTFLHLAAGFALLAATAVADERDEPGTFVVNRGASLYARPSADAEIVHQLRPGTVIGVVRVLDQWYEVHSASGRPNGFVRRSYAEPFDGGDRRRFREGTFRLTNPAVVRSGPDMDASAITTLDAGATLRVVGRSGNWYRVESEHGNRPPGYIPVISAERLE